MRRSSALEADPHWYKDAIVYELHVRSFFDSNGDGVGDFVGLIEKLDYLMELGVTALWLLPFYPSPLKDDGYDIADYANVHPTYGALADVRQFIREAHKRGLRVITELVCNHTSDQHPWFQRARRAAPGSVAREFYVWSETPERWREARIIFQDFEASNWTWDPVAGAYYWHRFYSHQPDLNFDHPPVRRAITRAVDFWLAAGVDGLRLDAVPYLFERDGTSCENLPETHAFLKELRAHVDAAFADRVLLAEANQWPEEAAAYFGSGDECHMCFHFPLMPRLFMSIRMEDRFPVVDILEQTPPIPPTTQWGIFLRNHDELTLEMVTDEERDYMYRAYTGDPEARINLGIRRRLAPLLGNNRRRIELMNGLLFSLPGTPFIYYGDEIGMGDNIFLGDRDGVRAPMQWSGDRNAGFSRANRQRLFLPVIVDPEYHYEAVNVEAQLGNPQSLLWWMRRFIALRRRHPAFGRGSLEFLHPENRKVLAFVRRTEDERILVVANLSRFAQPVSLDLAAFRGTVPVELFGQTPFPAVDDAPYRLTLGPHSFYWFVLEEPAAPAAAVAIRRRSVELGQRWQDALSPRARRALAESLPEYIRQRRWFAGKSRSIRAATIRELIPLGRGARRTQIAFVDLAYSEGEGDTYVVPLARLPASRLADAARSPAQIAAIDGDDAFVVDAVGDPDFGTALLDLISRHRRAKGDAGTLVGEQTEAFAVLRGARGTELHANLAEVEQSNNSLVFGERLMLKLFRRLESGINPELELGRALTASRFAHIAPTAGSIEYRPERGDATTIGVLQAYVPSEGDAWSLALAAFEEFAGAFVGQTAPQAGTDARTLLALGTVATPPALASAAGGFLDRVALLGRRTAELHAALAAVDDPAFTPEPFSQLYKRSIYQSMHAQAARALDALRAGLPQIADDAREDARAILGSARQIEERFRSLRDRTFSLQRIRTHGDLHLGQVLVTANDFVFIDFEGEPARSMRERRLRRSALRDVAGMLRSLSYASETGRAEAMGRGAGPELAGWAAAWRAYVSARYLASYLEASAGSATVPRERDDLVALLDALLVEKALYEVSYELGSRPARVGIPLAGLRELLR
ncbi:MAG TPA: maltose alpha-D-glucosyltransferase [Candidatus Limnocylindria bacterium]|nr:maltose alpha-D-glucosyltransferase [Candidatus Limnocylindria bacterium]